MPNSKETDLTEADELKETEEGATNSKNGTEKVENVQNSPDKNAENKEDGHGGIIAAHYNTEDSGFEKRNTSRILHLRNFNNWIKSMLIDEFLKKIQNKKPFGMPIKALDMCCGRGGDLLKWRNGNITHLICSDIASLALENCQKRYEDLQKHSRSLFTAEFYAGDLTKLRLREKYNDPSIRFDIVSCQFAFHYCFESLPQAECMIRNAAECLAKNGFFIGTIPDANAIVEAQKKANSNEFGNDVFKITFDEETVKQYPLFGAKYNFHLSGVVDCPEFLVYFPMFVKLAEKYGLKLVEKMGFQQYFDKKKVDGKFLMNRMGALETYPPSKEKTLTGSESKDYTQAREYFEENPQTRNIGTLSEPEWEVTSLYLVFAFQKT